jgi:hypothetical protein
MRGGIPQSWEHSLEPYAQSRGLPGEGKAIRGEPRKHWTGGIACCEIRENTLQCFLGHAEG